VIALSLDILIGMAIGFVVATLLFSGQTALGQFSRQSPFGCLLGVICLCIGFVLLFIGGYLRVHF